MLRVNQTEWERIIKYVDTERPAVRRRTPPAGCIRINSPHFPVEDDIILEFIQLVLLPCHGDMQAFLRADQVVMVVRTLVELDPVDGSVKLAGLSGIVG